MTEQNVTATPQSTRETLARYAGRGYTPVRANFVQVKRGGGWRGSTLGRMVSARQPRALNAYLMVLMTWGFVEERNEPLAAGVWARALSPDAPAPEWSRAAMSRVWETLEDFNLVERDREARLVRVTPRREDGRGVYTRPRPDQAKKADTYFTLPDAYWTEGWFDTLTFPGRALLLVLLHGTSGRDETALTYERMQEWYGISPKTAQNGIEDLRRHGLVVHRKEWVRADLSAIGIAPRHYYTPTGPFSRAARQKIQAEAAEAAQARSQASGGVT